MTQNLKELFDAWGRTGAGDFLDRQWLLSKWEVIDGIVWPKSKIDLMLTSIVDGLQLRPSHSIADLGCGGGWILKLLKPKVRSVVGMDFSRMMLRHARQYCPKDRFVCGELGHLPFRDQSLDRCLSYFVFLNFQDDAFIEWAILDILRVLKTNGRALIGQLPDHDRSREYDRAKKDYLEYCAKHFKLGYSHREICQAPQKLFRVQRLKRFLNRKRIPFEFQKSFNPFYRPGADPMVSWRFDLVLRRPVNFLPKNRRR